MIGVYAILEQQPMAIAKLLAARLGTCERPPQSGRHNGQSDTPLSTCPVRLWKELGQRWGRGNKSAAITLKSEDMTRVGGRGAWVGWV